MNENQDNNLQNSVENSTPIEPVEMPTPIEAQAPIDEPTPVESQAPVVEPTPIAPTSVVEPTPVAPTPVQPVQPVVEPAPNVAPVVNSAPVSEPVIATKKSNPIVVVLLILVLIGVCGYGLYKYTDILKPKANKAGNDTTTSTTTTATSSSLAFNSFDDFVSAVSKNQKNDQIVDLSSDFTYLNFDLKNKCVNNGDKVSFKIDSYDISYTCEGGLNEELNQNEWSADVIVNGTYKTHVDYVYVTDTTYPVYTNGKYFIEFTQSSGGVGHNKINSIKDINGNVVLSDINYYNMYAKSENDNGITFDVVNKNNILYFMASESTEDGMTNCSIKYIDLNANKLEVKDTKLSGSCYYMVD